jgi:hypothetical protein
MDIKKLQALGGFVSQTLVAKEITFTRPRLPEEGEGAPVNESGVIHVRKRSARDFLDMHHAEGSEKTFIALHRCVFNEDGTPFFSSPNEAGLLAEWILGPMLVAVNEVNSFLPKPSPPKTSSGTTSRSPSAAGLSGSGRTQSRKRSVRPG